MKRVFFNIIFLLILISIQNLATDVDIYQNMEVGSDGNLLTVGMMNTGSFGENVTWTFPQGNQFWISTENTMQFPSEVIINGQSVSTSGTRSWRFRNREENQYVKATFDAGNPEKMTVGFYFTTNQSDGNLLDNQHDNVEISANNTFAVFQQVVGSPKDGYPHVRAHSVTQPGWVTTFGEERIRLVPGKTYWVNLHFDSIAGKAIVAVFDPENNYAQVGNNSVAQSVAGTSISGSVNFGRCSSHSNWPSNDTSSYFDNIMIDYTNGAFPLLPVISGSTYWVSPNGVASWQQANSATPLNGTAACNIETANANASAGDTVYFRGGTYLNQTIKPIHSGAGDDSRIIFSNYNDEEVIITGDVRGILLNGNSFITINGISFISMEQWALIRGNSHHNTISYCTFDLRHQNSGSWQGVLIYENSTYNRVCNCSFSRWIYGSYDEHRGGLLDIGRGTNTSTDESNYNLIENNVFYYGGHHTFAIYSKYNVIRNNYTHNETWDYEGYRNSISHGSAAGRNLYQGNNYAFSNGASSISLRSPNNILRFNLFYNNGHGGVQNATDEVVNNTRADYNHFYNNVFYNNGHTAIDPSTSGGVYFADWGRGDPTGNILKNNIFRNNAGGPVTYSGVSDLQIIENNWDTQNPLFVYDGSALFPFATKPDFHLQSNSPCINAGVFLTAITSPDGSGTQFTVEDAGYFMNGWGIIEGDMIQLENQSQKVKITNVNYTTNKITVNSVLTWAQGQGVALAYKGNAPDIGAYEYAQEGGEDTQAPSTPTSLSATVQSSSQINLSWTASTDNVSVTGYRIYRNGAQIGTSNNTSYTDIGLSASTTYTYNVLAYDAAGNESNLSDSVDATTQQESSDTEPPSVPQNLSAIAQSSSQINLNWTSSTDNVAVTGYRIYRNGINIAGTVYTSYSDVGLSPQTTYTYRVLAFDAAGNNSGQSNQASATTLSGGGGGGNTNHAPVLSHIGNKTVKVNYLLSFKVYATDQDNDSLSFTAINLPYGASFNAVSGIFSWQAKRVGRYYVTFRVSDGKLSDSETIMIWVKQEGNDDGNGNQYGIVVDISAERKTDKSWTSKKDYGEIIFTVKKGNTKVSKIILYRKEPGEIYKAIKEFPYNGEETVKTVDSFLKSNTVYTYKIMLTDLNNYIIAGSKEVSI